MTKRIFRSILFVTLIVAIACFALFMIVLYDYYGQVQEGQLKSELGYVACGVEKNGMDYLRSLDASENRLTWIAADGTVVFDNQTDPSGMENHSDREEVKDAVRNGSGKSSRYSATLTEQTFYYALRLSDGSVMRISVSRYTMISLVLSMLYPICIVLVIALILSGVIATRLSKKIVKPFEMINYDEPLANDTYEELMPILTRMEQQKNEIKIRESELEDRKNRFLAVTRNMNEGLVLLDNNGEITSINPAAKKFFDTTAEPVGRLFETIGDTHEILGAIEEAKKTGDAELQTERNGREYLIRVSEVSDGGGVVLLIIDITERVFGERNRKEFTANVSHELKTPLQAIMGRAELIENNLVKEEDIPGFIKRIRSDASRLVALIDDIIGLSQLDEKSALPMEDVELLELVRNEIGTLERLADEKDVKLSVEGVPVHMQGVRGLLHEIVFNLCDNAIKYNRPGGTVTVSVGETFISVKDTGIGIEKENQDRIFERFYRVDKSHSRKIGGTGLGLSIVKHAVEYMDGTITVNSTPGEGTEITVSF